MDATAVVPGSKSIANRALVVAALADGDSQIDNVPDGDDTAALVDGLGALGVAVSIVDGTATVGGTGGRFDPVGSVDEPVRVHARLAGTTSRFLTAVAALVPGPVVIDGDPPLRRRPIGPLHDALAQLGVAIDAAEGPGTLPATVRGPLTVGGAVSLPGHVSSQYLSALMMVAPLLEGGLRITLTSPLVSLPYVRLTARVMASFGATDVALAGREIWVGPGRYQATSFAVEPDASTASYPLALAAVAGGRVRVRDLRADSAQGDAAIVDLLIGMGCRPTPGDDLGVERDPAVALTGIDADLSEVSDLVPTLAAVAATATTSSHFTGIGFIRAKESDRLDDLAEEFAKVGAAVTVEHDGLRIDPAPLHGGATLDPHHDHRLAMAFGVLGAVVPGVRVADHGVVSKSWPGYWEERDRIVDATRTRRERRPVAAFDVDGTLTTADCVVPFLRLVAGTPSLVGGVARRGHRAFGALLRRDRDQLKAISAAAVFAGRPIAQIEGLGRTFAATVAAERLRPDTVARLRWHLDAGHRGVLVSASFGVYLRPLAARIDPRLGVIATELVVDADGRCTGELVGGNCRGQAKVARLHSWLADHAGGRAGLDVWAYGDSPGDRELLADADHAVWAGDPIPAVPT